MAQAVTSSKYDHLFRTDELGADLKRRAVRGGVVTMVSQIAKLTIQIGSTAALARLVAKEDFGLVAMVTVVTNFVGMFKDLGLSMATVQRREITHEQVTNLFWVNVGLSAVLGLITAAIAPVLSMFVYHREEVLYITLALAGTFVFGGLTAQHTALLRRRMEYRSLAFIEVGGQFAGVLVAVLMAWRGYGYWALVAMNATGPAFQMIAAWTLSPWRPGAPSRGSGVGSMIAFGSHLTGTSMANYFARNADAFLIGWSAGAVQLGLYNRAYTLLTLPLSQINAPVSDVVVPGLSRLQGEPERYRSFYLRALSFVTAVTLPLVAMLIVCSTEVVLFLLGKDWLESAEIFRLLAISALLQPVLNTAGWLYITSGRTAAMLRWGIASSVWLVTSFVVGLPWGAKGVAFAYAIAMLAQAWPCVYFATRGSAVRMRDVVSTTLPPLVSAGLGGVAAYVLRGLLPPDTLPVLVLFACGTALTAVHAAVLLLVFRRGGEYADIVRQLRSRAKERGA